MQDVVDLGHAWMQVSVNLSPRQFRQKDIVKAIETILLQARLPARCLELEITETTIMHSTAHTIGALHELTALGVRISVDDFGTGYSSLAYLHASRSTSSRSTSRSCAISAPTARHRARRRHGGAGEAAQARLGRGRRGNQGAARLPARNGDAERRAGPLPQRPARRGRAYVPAGKGGLGGVEGEPDGRTAACALALAGTESEL